MLKIHGLVTVATAGTKVRLTDNEVDPAADFTVHSLLIVAQETNTGRIFIGGSTLDKATGVGVIAVLAIPTDNSIPSFDGVSSYQKLNDLYIDAEVNGDGVYVSCEKAG